MSVIAAESGLEPANRIFTPAEGMQYVAALVTTQNGQQPVWKWPATLG